MVTVTLQNKKRVSMPFREIGENTWFTGEIKNEDELCLKLTGNIFYRPAESIPIHTAGAFFGVFDFKIVHPVFHVSFDSMLRVPFERIDLGCAFLSDDELYIKASSKQGLYLGDGQDILHFDRENVLPVNLEIVA